MDEIYWAIGSMLIVMLLVYFLPLGITKKGKVILVGISFLLALGGIAATASFSFLLTALILVILVFFVSYLLDQRLGKSLFIEDDSNEEQQENEEFLVNSVMQTAASHENRSSKNDSSLEPIKLFKEEKQNGHQIRQTIENEIPELLPDSDDVSFLLNRTIELEEDSKKMQEEPKYNDVDYLSEIEELLEDDPNVFETDESVNQISKNDHEIPVISFEEKPLKKSEETDAKISYKEHDANEIPILPFHEKEEVKS